MIIFNDKLDLKEIKKHRKEAFKNDEFVADCLDCGQQFIRKREHLLPRFCHNCKGIVQRAYN